MIRFNNDYNCGAHPQILQALMDTNTESYGGYGVDPWCEKAETPEPDDLQNDQALP
jgi:threonine aldolase